MGAWLPAMVGSSYAQCGSPMATMFISRMPSSATPRATSIDEMRSRPTTGAASVSIGAPLRKRASYINVRSGVVRRGWVKGEGKKGEGRRQGKRRREKAKGKG